MRKLPARWRNTVFAFVMAALMSFLMSAAITALNLGFPPDFFARWMTAWFPAWAIATPAVLIVAPIARRLTNRWLVEAESPADR